MKRVTVVIMITLAAAGCHKQRAPEESFGSWPPNEFKNADEAYPELPPVDVPGLVGLEDSPSLGYDLSTVKNLGPDWGTPEQRRLLRDHGFVVTDETYNQIFSFYTVGIGGAFITTDSALYAYFINLEYALQELELAQAEKLPELLKKLRRRLAKESTKYRLAFGDRVWKKAARDLDDYLLVAEALTYVDKKSNIPKGTPPEVAGEIELILAAQGPAVSPLRGVPLDYGRFKPRGLYAKKSAIPGFMLALLEPDEYETRVKEIGNDTRRLKNYYRAVTWLREVPFRVSDENETLQALYLAAIDIALGPGESPVAAFNAPYVEFLGPGDDPGMSEYRKVYLAHVGSSDRLARDEECRKKAFAAVRDLRPPRHTTIPDVAAVKDPSLYAGFRFIPRPALYENEILGTLGPFGLGRVMPSGEELFAAMGSRAAQEVVKGREARRVPGYDKLFPAAVTAAEKAEKTYDTEICRKRRALYRTLLATPQDHELPAYYRHSAWRYKDLNTCLAGWSHQRYIWNLHSKITEHYRACNYLTPNPDIVEPNVAFFQALAELSRATGRFFDRHGAGNHRFGEIAFYAEALADIASRQLRGEPLSRFEYYGLLDYGKILADLCGFYGESWSDDSKLPPTAFHTPLGVDLYTGNERVVGQGKPRAIYVICEYGGYKFVAQGGVLSYRDWVGPAWGEGKMTEERWLKSAANDELIAPAWQEKYKLSELSRAELNGRQTCGG
ncbi:MAG: DUF3160 domain-containing protein [Candidatus Zixiibacteriota bacterium]